MVDGVMCAAQMNQKLSVVNDGADPKAELLKNYSELLKERVVIDSKGEEIGSRLKDLVTRATAEARANQQKGEPFSRAVVRNALRMLNYNYCEATPGGLPTGPAYERALPDRTSPKNFGHEKVNYPMSQYPSLSYLPVGGLGTPMCEVDYTTCYIKEGQMVQDSSIRQLTVKIGGKAYDLSKTEGTYYALYPFSERTYTLPTPVSILQYSPIIPGNYQVSSLPVEIMEVVAENPTDKPIQLTFTITQDNILGWYPKKGKQNPKDPSGVLVWNKQSKGNYSESISNSTGVVFKKKGNQEELVRAGSGIEGQIAIVSQAVPGKVAVTPILQKQGRNSAGLTITITLQPKEKISHPIIVAYDNPFYNLQHDPTNPASPGVRMPKFYTRFYGATGQNAQKIAEEALTNYKPWKAKITEFQKKITDDPTLPDFFKQALLNELYVLAETGIWEGDQGRFAYLESIDYKMYNTSDVNSYTWAILALFPELERKDLLEFAKMVPLSDPTRRWFGTDRFAHIPPEQWRHLYWTSIKDPGAVCHDLGGLLGQGVFPFTNRCNEFDWSNTNMWIDLAPKFVLRLWRYITFMKKQTGKMDLEFIKQVYPSAIKALDTLKERWGNKDTFVPMSKGIPDWTYDTISGQGYTPNVVTQWLGALEAIQEMAKLMGDEKAVAKYTSWFERGKPALEKLWNKKGYYNAFVTPDGRKVNNNIHSDILFGDFYARMSGLPPVVPAHRATKALETIYAINGKKWSEVGNHGPLGLVNLRGPNGEQNKTEQGDEGWTGTMLLNAAHQIWMGKTTKNQKLVQNGWDIVHGFFNVVYSQSPDSQHWFGRTPEGYTNPDDVKYDEKGKKYKEGKKLPNGMVVPATGRAPKYMRALAIWAVYAAVKGNKMPFGFYETDDRCKPGPALKALQNAGICPK